MRRRVVIIAGILLLLFIGLLVQGVLMEQPGYVLDNAQTICYT
jgi:hypothetical protein